MVLVMLGGVHGVSDVRVYMVLVMLGVHGVSDVVYMVLVMLGCTWF